MVKGEKIGSYCLTEIKAGSDVAAIETRAERKGDEYIINGHKKFIMLGNLADIFLVYAKTKPEAGYRGITVFIVERETEGISFPKQEKKLGLRATPTSEVKFENVRVPAENILGGPEQENRGIYVALDALDHGRCGVAAQGLGAAQAAFEQALKFASEREQFGKPIIGWEAIQWMLADMATEIEAARLLILKAAYLKDKGEKEEYIKLSSMAKLYASEVAMKTTIKAIQIHGGYGYTKDYPVERYFRDAKITEIYEGTNEIQRIVIARRVLKNF